MANGNDISYFVSPVQHNEIGHLFLVTIFTLNFLLFKREKIIVGYKSFPFDNQRNKTLSNNRREITV